MNHILVPTDFSDSANNALNYAVEIAKATKASITLYHAYQLPVMISETQYIPVLPLVEIEEEGLKSLHRLQADIARKAPQIKVDLLCKPGLAVDEITDTAKETRYDLIVMGINGSGKLAQLFGSTATAVAGNSKIPVLVVPPNATFVAPKKIVFAFDYKEIKETKHVNMLLELAKLFSAKIHVLNIVHSGKGEIPLERALAGMQIHDILEETDHKLSFPHDSETIHGIDEYLKHRKGDLLVMIKREHGFVYNLFHASHTKKMAFHTAIPLLVIHD